MSVIIADILSSSLQVSDDSKRITEIISFFDIVHCLFLMTQNVSVAGSVSRFGHFAVIILGQGMLSGAYLNKLTDPRCPVTEKGSI